MRIDYEKLYTLAEKNKEPFRFAEPFPNIVFDNFLDEETYHFVCNAFPSIDSPIWKKPENIHTKGKCVTRRGKLDLKESFYHERARRVFFEFNSGLFLRFCCLLTGIENLVSDPYLIEGGFHCSESGSYLDIHADFSHNDKLGLERRLNMLFYLNDDWRDEYGGALKLYDGNLIPKQFIQPVGNRCVIFETSDTSYHGFPEPISSPKEQYRRSIALYYYSVPRSERKRSKIFYPTDPAWDNPVTKD